MSENENQIFKIANVPGKGMGLIATEKIKRGQLILAEKPIITRKNPFFNKQAELNKLKERFDQLPEDEKKLIYSLYDCYSPQSPTIQGIMKTNEMTLGIGSFECGLFLTISRLNHSCRSNIYHHWNEENEVEEIFAMCDILPNEELLISYIDVFASRDTRQMILKTRYNFICTCSLCSITDSDLVEKSDQRRKLINDLFDRVPDEARFYPDRALKQLDLLFKLLDEEGMSHEPGYAGLASYYYFEILYQTTRKNLKEWARKTIDNFTVCKGKENAIKDLRLKNELIRYYN